MLRLAALFLCTLCLAPFVAAQTQTPGAIPPRTSAAPASTFTGSWVGAIDLGGVRRRVALVLRDRERGEVYGYVMSGQGWWRVAEGELVGSRLRLRLVIAPETGQTTTIDVAGTVFGTTFTGTSDDGSGAVPLTMRRRSEVLHERLFAFADLVGGNPANVVTLGVVLDDAGRLVAGGYEGSKDCALFGCIGKVTSFSESGNDVSITLRSGTPCPGTATLTGTLDPSSLFYFGTWDRSDCNGVASGTLVGARATRTRSDHVLEILEGLDAIADQLEAGVPFGGSHPAVSSAYLHFGRTASDLLGGFDQEMARYSAIRVRYHSFYLVSTVADPWTLPDLLVGDGATFEEVRSGLPSGGGPRERYVDTLAEPRLQLMRDWADAGGWVVDGNQLPGFDLPFDHTFGATAVEVPTAGGTVYASFGSWGAHFGPMTGHLNGDAKGNGIGYLTEGESDMTELVGNGNGTYETGETWGYWGGLAGDGVRDKTPVYKAVWDGTVVGVEYDSAPSGVYFGNPPQWEVYVEFPGRLELRIGHVASIADDLRLQILALTGIDTNTYVGAPGTEILSGNEIPVSAGDELCLPQMLADPVPGFPGYYRSMSPDLAPPWAQMEWALLGPSGRAQADICHYELLAPTTLTALQGVIDAEVVDPLSQRYRFLQDEKWLWGAEARACLTYSVDPRDFSSLYTQLGGWFEVDGPTTTTDELVAFAPMATDTAAYDPSLYDPANAGWLLGRARTFPLQFTWLMPDGSSVMPFYPRAEVLDLQDDQFLVKWRDLGYAPGGGPQAPVYQRAAYLLDENGLKVKWGLFADTPAAAALPTLLSTDPCNDVDVLCYDHTHQTGF